MRRLLTLILCARRSVPTLSVPVKRKLFVDGKFQVDLVPLNVIPAGKTFLSIFTDRHWGEEITRVTAAPSTDHLAEATFTVWGRGFELAPPPFPTDSEGSQLCHGTILGTNDIDGAAHPERRQFSTRPLRMQSAMAMRRWLKVRNVTESTALREDSYGG